jgi:hypothetical protein
MCSSSGGGQEKGKTGWNSAFNAQGSRLMIIIVQVKAWKYM